MHTYGLVSRFEFLPCEHPAELFFHMIFVFCFQEITRIPASIRHMLFRPGC